MDRNSSEDNEAFEIGGKVIQGNAKDYEREAADYGIEEGEQASDFDPENFGEKQISWDGLNLEEDAAGSDGQRDHH